MNSDSQVPHGTTRGLVDVALPVLIFISLSAKSFDPISTL